uniref:S-layer homology domain-containing protein n=1 Tax=Gemmiger formicilis TaxID=745368 RepID=UPI004025ACE5
MKILKRKTLAALLALSLLASLLPLGAQPALAVDTAPQTLYVGSTIISTGYWTSFDGGKVWTSPADEPEGNNYIYYDGQGTLKLHNVTIQGADNTGSPPYGAGIYALCSQDQPVALTIELIGTNTITGYYGIFFNAEIDASSYGTDASLTITGENNGSLKVSGSNHGIFVKSGTGNASVTIENASVDAKTTQTNSGYAGVCVQSSANATGSPNISLSVNGGSLTTSASEGNDGIQFYVGSSQASDATTSLTVSKNAIVDARNGGIKASDSSMSDLSDQIKVSSGDGTNGGIVFDGSAGTVYGSVTLQDALEIKSGETLTVPEGASLTVPSGTTLTNNGTIDNGGTLTNSGTVTNNGTINVEDGGKLEGTPTGGTVVNAPTIGTQPVSQTVTAGNTATFTVAASGENLTYQWQQSTDSGSNWTAINDATEASYTIDNTTTYMSGYQYRCVVSNSAGSVTSSAATLTVTQPVTGVKLNTETLELFTGNIATLTATVEPDNATKKNVTWSSDNANVATVDNGKVTAVGAGKTTITVTTEDGGKTATCTVTVTDKTYAISADTTALNFGSAYTGYAQPAAQTVTVKNTGNQQVTVTLPAANDFIITAGTGFTDGSAAIKPGETATFTVQPKTGLSVGTYSDTITVSGSENVIVTIPASFTVKSRPSYNPPTVSEETTEAIADAQPGETVTVDLSSGSTTLDKEVFETLAGKDVTLVIDLGDDVSWTVKGSDVPEDADFTDIDMGVTMNSDGIPVDVVNAITSEHGSVQLELAHDGAFGFTMTLTAPLGKENAGYWANLYHYDEEAEALNFEAAAKIDEDGSVTIPFSHASQYAIVIDTHSHATVDVSDLFSDIAPDAWYKDAVQYAYDNGLMTGVSATEFDPEATTTRAMIVSILARLENVTTAEAAGFADVDDEWYATAVNWAANVGVVNGYEDNTFRPNTAITREQLAAILMNYAAYKGEDVSARADLATYTDQPSTWAEEAMSWAVAEGLITGVTADTLQPQGAATRAQVAAILQRFLSE